MADSEEQDAKEPISNRDRFDKSKRNLLWASSLLFILAIGFLDAKMIESPFYSIKLSLDKRFIVCSLIAAIIYFFIGFWHDASFVKISNSEAAKNFEELELSDSIHRSSQNLILKISEIESSMSSMVSHINSTAAKLLVPTNSFQARVGGGERQINELYDSSNEPFEKSAQNMREKIQLYCGDDHNSFLITALGQFRIELREILGQLYNAFVSGKNLPKGIELAIFQEDLSQIEKNLHTTITNLLIDLKESENKVRENSEIFVKISSRVSKSSQNMLSYYEIRVPIAFAVISIISGLASAYFGDTFKSIISIVFP